MSLERYFAATPWALPITFFAVLFFLYASVPMSRVLSLPSWVAFFYGVGITSYVGVTATPSIGGWDGARHARYIVWSLSFPHLSELLQPSDSSLNFWVAVPMGAAAALALVYSKKVWLLLTVALLPVLTEGIQWLLPQLGRSAFFVSDVLANWVGVLAGGGIVMAVYLGARLAGMAPRPTTTEVH